MFVCTKAAIVSYSCENARNRSEQELKDQLDAWNSKESDLIQPFYIHPKLARKFTKRKSVSNLHLNNSSVKQSLIYGTRKCPKSISKRKHDVMDTSSCPWYIVLTYDEMRYPSTLINAKCKCRNCIGVEKNVSKSRERNCEPITIKQKVLRRELTERGTLICKDGVASYLETWEDVPIACLCVSRRTKKIV